MFDSVIGVDCATTPAKTGLARARRAGSIWTLTDLHGGSSDLDPAGVVSEWLKEQPRTLVALDAPLGWSGGLGTLLARHRAGARVGSHSDLLFSRVTDRHVHERYGKKPLEVGASWIARTAVAALDLLDEVRRTTSRDLPLWWPHTDVGAGAAVEVYPAATLRAHSAVASSGYKVAGSRGRSEVARLVRSTLDVPDRVDLDATSDHGIDAALCVLAAIDVVEGRAVPPNPDHLDAAEREGWIWVRAPAS